MVEYTASIKLDICCHRATQTFFIWCHTLHALHCHCPLTDNRVHFICIYELCMITGILAILLATCLACRQVGQKKTQVYFSFFVILCTLLTGKIILLQHSLFDKHYFFRFLCLPYIFATGSPLCVMGAAAGSDQAFWQQFKGIFPPLHIFQHVRDSDVKASKVLLLPCQN